MPAAATSSQWWVLGLRDKPYPFVHPVTLQEMQEQIVGKELRPILQQQVGGFKGSGRALVLGL